MWDNNMSSSYDVFKKAYNNFDSRPLSSKWGKEFYVNDFTKDVVNEITTTIRITDRFKKMLVIAHSPRN
jgi:hypothetical protein